MRSPKSKQKPSVRREDVPTVDRRHALPDGETDALEAPFETDENELDETHLHDDDQWDVFILDDDGDSLPEYGDFWFPD